jgi:hypothetical protein
MSDVKRSDPNPKLSFKQMSRGQKTMFILKLAVSIVSFGMIYPNLMSD